MYKNGEVPSRSCILAMKAFEKYIRHINGNAQMCGICTVSCEHSKGCNQYQLFKNYFLLVEKREGEQNQ